MVFFRIFLKISPMNDDEVSRIFRILRRGLRNSFEFEKVLMTADMILSLYMSFYWLDLCFSCFGCFLLNLKNDFLSAKSFYLSKIFDFLDLETLLFCIVRFLQFWLVHWLFYLNFCSFYSEILLSL